MKFEEYLKENSDQLGSKEPSMKLWDKIEESIMVDDLQSIPRKKFGRWLLPLLGVGLITVFAWLIFDYQKEQKSIQVAQLELEEKIDEIKHLLGQSQTSSRLRAINKVGFLEKDQTELLPQILLNTVKSDPSLSVKCAALNALEDFVEIENVRIGLIEILSTSTDNQLKMRVMAFLSRVNESRIEPFIDDILKDEDSNELWKSEAGEALEKIKNI